MDLLTTNEAAKRLRVTPSRIRQMIREGKIEARQIGRDYVIAESSLESVKTYGKAGRPKKTEDGDGETISSEKSFKTIFDIEAEAAETLAGSLDSGTANLLNNKEHSRSFAEAAAKYIGCVDSGKTDLGSNEKHLEGFGTKKAEKANLLKRG